MMCTCTTHANKLTHQTPQHLTPNNIVRPDTHNPLSVKRSVQPTHKHTTKTFHTSNPNTKSIPHTTTNKLTINLRPNIASHPPHHPTKAALAKTPNDHSTPTVPPPTIAKKSKPHKRKTSNNPISIKHPKNPYNFSSTHHSH